MPITVKGLSSSLALLVLSSRSFRQALYETFLRSHQGLAIFYLYTIWRHIAPGTPVSRVYIWTAVVIFSASSLSQSLIVITRNYSPSQGCGRALVTRINDAVRIRIRVSRSLKVRAGQYLNIWMPTMGFRSTLQSHPFMIASWTEFDPIYLELLIKPESGFTNRLLKNAIKHFEPEQAQSAGHDHNFTNHETWVVWYSGPHGSPEPVGDYGSVLMIATGFGIASQIPILQELVRGHSNCTVRTRRLHLVWQVDSWGKQGSSQSPTFID